MANKGSKIPSYDLVMNPKGYFHKREITNMDPSSLVSGSKNVIINDGDKVATRKGFTLDGTAGAITNRIKKSYDFVSKNGKKILRSFDGATANTGQLQVRFENTSGTIDYYDLLTSLTYTDFNLATWWYATESTRVLCFVDGTTSLRMWGGGVAEIASNTGTTLTKTGTETWAQAGFFISLSGRTVTIPGYGTYTYTGGETTTTLTGLTGLPAITAGTPAFQGVVTTTSLTGVPAGTTYDLIMTKDNHLMLGDTQSSVVYGSKTSDYLDYGYTSPLRVPSEGFKITLDNFAVGFTQDSDNIYVFAGYDDIYKVNLTLSQDQATEAIVISKLRSGAGQSAISQGAIIPVKNGIMYFTNEKTLSWLTSVENVFTPQSLPISDPIKDDFDSFDLTGATGIFYRNEIWLAIPLENVVYRYDFDKELWHSPQTLPVSCFSIIGEDLYGHSNNRNETYKLEDGDDDNGVTIDFVAAFAYRSFGERGFYKQFDEYYTEVYMRTATVLTCTHRFEYQGAEQIVEKTIYGTDSGLMFAPNVDGSLGKNPLGSQPLGSVTEDVEDLSKYRCVHEMKKVDFFEHQIIFSSNDKFEIVAHGGNVVLSPTLPTSYIGR